MLIMSDIDGVIVDPCEFVKKYLLIPKSDWKTYYSHTLEFVEIRPIIELLASLRLDAHRVMFMTGRSESNRKLTVQQINNAFSSSINPSIYCNFVILMRQNNSKSSTLKLDWCMTYKPDLVLEDDPSVVLSLREAGFTVLQVHGHRIVSQSADKIPE